MKDTIDNARHHRPHRAMSRRAKAAVIVRLMAEQKIGLPLIDLPDDLQVSLAEEMTALSSLDAGTISEIVQEFSGELEDIGLTTSGGLKATLGLLDGSLSDRAMQTLRERIGDGVIGDPWSRLRDAETEDLIRLLQTESTEVSAILLTKLPVPKAAKLLSQLAGEAGRRLAYAVSQISAVTPETVHKIGLSLVHTLEDRPSRAFDTEPPKRVGAILNLSSSEAREDILGGLHEADSQLAEDVRKAIFTFADVPARIDPRDVPKIIRTVEQQVLVTALAGATGDLVASADFILANISQRMAQNLRDEIEERGTPKPDDVEDATNSIIAEITALVDGGQMEFLDPDAA